MASAQQQKRNQFILIGGTLIAVIVLLAYLGAQEYAPGKAEEKAAAKEVDPTTLTQSEEIQLGLKASPALVQQYKGVSTNTDQNALVMRVGSAIAGTEDVAGAGWKFQFQLLAEPDIINAFALPGGQIFVTSGLLNRLTTEGEVAAMLAHQIAHVIARDGVKKLAADGTASTGLANEDTMGLLASQLVGTNFSSQQETAADLLAVKLMGDTGYNPNAMLGFIKILATAYYAGSQVEYFTTHPNPTDRVKAIQAAIAAAYPAGVPDSMSK